MVVTGNDFSEVVNYDLAFDPGDLNQWKVKETKKNKF